MCSKKFYNKIVKIEFCLSITLGHEFNVVIFLENTISYDRCPLRNYLHVTNFIKRYLFLLVIVGKNSI